MAAETPQEEAANIPQEEAAKITSSTPTPMAAFTVNASGSGHIPLTSGNYKNRWSTPAKILPNKDLSGPEYFENELQEYLKMKPTSVITKEVEAPMQFVLDNVGSTKADTCVLAPGDPVTRVHDFVALGMVRKTAANFIETVTDVEWSNNKIKYSYRTNFSPGCCVSGYGGEFSVEQVGSSTHIESKAHQETHPCYCCACCGANPIGSWATDIQAVEAKWKKSQAAKTTNDAELTAIVVTEPAQEAMEEKKEPEQEPNEGWVESLQEAALDGIGFVATVGGAAVETVAHGVAAAALSAADCATLGMVDSIGDMQEEQYEAMIDGRDDVTAGIEAHMEADWYRSPPPNDMSDWMSKLPDETLLTKMWIPGTHDTVSDGGGDLAECQSWSVKDQLESGIRVFDIRMKHDGDELKGFHGIIDMHHGFAEVVGALEDFIAKNPREVIMVRLKKEGEAGEHANKFHDQVIKSLGKPELWDLRVKQFGTLGSHRGKIIFLAYYSQMLLQRQKLEVQDSYKTADEDAKFELIKTHSQKVNDADTLSLNFCSAVGMDGWTCFKAPGAVAFQLNKTLMESMASQETKLGPGCFFLDFPGPQVVKNIIQANK